MKLVTFVAEGKQLVGALDGDEVVVIDIPDMRSLFALGTPVQDYAEKLKMDAQEALAAGMDEKSNEFRAAGAKIYQPL